MVLHVEAISPAVRAVLVETRQRLAVRAGAEQSSFFVRSSLAEVARQLDEGLRTEPPAAVREKP